MPSKIFKLKLEASLEDIQWSQQMASQLLRLGFDGSELNDLVFQVAESVSLQLKIEFGAVMAQKLAHQEFSAAEEINQHSIEDQLLVLGQWYGLGPAGHEQCRRSLSQALGIELTEVQWAASACV